MANFISRLVVIDIGNTHTVVGLFQAGRLQREFRLATRAQATSDELGLLFTNLLRQEGWETGWVGVVVSNVVPALDAAIETGVKQYLGVIPWMVTPESPLPIKNRYQPPTAVGPDRLVNAVAAMHEFGSPVIVADFGTAITVDCVSSKREYLGGAILPGLQLAAESLARGTAVLPRAELQAVTRILGRTTQESLRAGIILGAAGAVTHLIRGLQQQLGGRVPVVATGGLAFLLQPHCPIIRFFRPALTLEGLRLIWEHRSKKHARRTA